MTLFIDADIKLFGKCKITVSSNNALRMDIKGSCAGGSVSLTTSDFNIMYYCIRYGDSQVLLNVRGEANLRAWITDLHRPRPRLQGTCDFVKRERSRVAGQVLPSLNESIEVGADVTDLTKYCVLRYVASNWGTDAVRVNSGRSIDQFVGPLRVLHDSLVAEGQVSSEIIISGDVEEPDQDAELEGITEAERLRLEVQRAQQQQANRVVVAPLPTTFLTVNANATANRMSRSGTVTTAVTLPNNETSMHVD